MNSARLIIELIAHHGNLSVPDLRSLSLVCKESSPIVQEELSKRRLTYNFLPGQESRWGPITFSRTHNGAGELSYYLLDGKLVEHGWFRGTVIDEYMIVGEIKTTVRYRDGKKEGIELRINGRAYSTMNHIDGVKHGEYRSVCDGSVEFTGYYESDRQTGLNRIWEKDWRHTEQKFVDKVERTNTRWRRRTNFKETKMVTNQKGYLVRSMKWYPDSAQLMHKATQQFNTYWWKNGQLNMECGMMNGFKEGPFIECYETGRIKIKCEYSKGQLHGDTKGGEATEPLRRMPFSKTALK